MCFPAGAKPAPVLTWATNSAVKLEQLIGDVDWITGSNTTSPAITRFNIEGRDIEMEITPPAPTAMFRLLT